MLSVLEAEIWNQFPGSIRRSLYRYDELAVRANRFSIEDDKLDFEPKAKTREWPRRSKGHDTEHLFCPVDKRREWEIGFEAIVDCMG
jgi:hypothetical protein